MLSPKKEIVADFPTIAYWEEKFNTMSIEKIVEQALQDRYLTPVMEAEVGRICDTASELSVEEYMALDRLMGALLTGEVVAVPRKQFINVMEELVLTEAISQIADIEAKKDRVLDVGDIAAFALNRLPPLYATTEEGAKYQRDRAKKEFQDLIAKQVSDAIEHNMDRPNFGIDRRALRPDKDVFQQVSNLLQDYANNFENNE